MTHRAIRGELKRILSRSDGEFIRKRLRDESANRSAGSAPEPERNTGIVLKVFRASIRNLVRERRNAADRYRIDAAHLIQAVWIEPSAMGLRGYFMPEDDQSTLYIYDVEAK